MQNEATCAATEDDCFVLRVLIGCYVVFRRDAVHAGAGNPYSQCHWRMHVYLLSEGFSEFTLLKDTTLSSWRRSFVDKEPSASFAVCLPT